MINAQGQFVPQQVPTPQIQQAGVQATMPTVANQQMNPQLQNQMLMRQANPSVINNMNMQRQLSPQALGAPQQAQPAQPSWVQSPANQAPQQMQQAPQWGPPPWMNQGQMQGQMPFGVAQGQQTQQGTSIEQGVQNNNPQSVQNFMSALHGVGAGSSNAMMNGMGQQGAQGQAGFQGFQSNGFNPQQIQQQYGGQNFQYGGNQGPSFMNSNTQMPYGGQGYAQNMSSLGGNMNMNSGAQAGGYSYGMAQGGTGGLVSGQGTSYGQNPTWQTPNPWGQPGNAAPGTPGSNYSNDEAGMSNYLGAGGQSPVAQTQAGSFYSGAAPGWGSYGVNPNGQSGYGPSAVSDVSAKKNIVPANKELEEFLNALGVYSYEYKDKQNGEGRHISTMAQDLEKTEIGKSMVETREDGLKQVNYGKGFAVMLASNALLNHKYNQLEAKLKNAILTNLKNKRK